MNVAVIGASDKPGRYSFLAIELLLANGHRVFPVHQRVKEIQGLKVYSSVTDITESLDTISLYISSNISDVISDSILAKKPHRIIFNPGAENASLSTRARLLGIETVESCTLVMLRNGTF